MTQEPFFFRDDWVEDVAALPLLTTRRRRDAMETLALFSLEATLGRRARRRVATARSLAMVVEVPSADWIEPIRAACRSLAEWDDSFARSGSSKSEDRPDRGNERVAQALARGRRVLGVSHACDRYLPSALVQAADIRVRLKEPTDEVVARVIRAATGGHAAVPQGIAQGIDYFTLCAAVRTGTTARSCIDRIIAAQRAAVTVDPTVANAPDFGTLAGFGASHEWGMRLIAGIEEWRSSGGAFPRDRNIVLASDPGLGKTTYARALAKATRLPLVSTSVSAWFTQSNGCLDGVLKCIDGIFSAQISSPKILFLDELDGIPNRATLSDRAREWWTPVVGSLLLHVETLYADPDAKVCVLGATNYEDRLDAALVRPGRLSRVIRIERPSAKDLAAILRLHLGGDLPELDLEPIAELGVGATGAQAVAWVEEARGAARENGRLISAGDLVDAIAPADTRTPEAIRRSVYHEAGHAVSMEILRVGEVQRVDVIERLDRGGSTNARGLLGTMPTRDGLERLVITYLAGRGAEIVFFGDASAGAGGSADSDLARATATVVSIHASLGLGNSLVYRGHGNDASAVMRLEPRIAKAVEDDLARLQNAAVNFVTENKALIAAVADLLVETRAIDGGQLRALIDKFCRHPDISALGGAA